MTAFEGLKGKIKCLISLLSTGLMGKEVMAKEGIHDSMVLEIFTKYSFNALAVSCGLLNVMLLSLRTEGTGFKDLFTDIRFLISFKVFSEH